MSTRQKGYKAGIAWSLGILGWVVLQQGDVVTARSLLQESLALFKELGDRQNVAQSLGGLAWVSFAQGDYAAARVLLEEGLAIFKVLGNKWFIAACFVGLGAVAAAEGEWAWAARLSGAADAQCEAIGAVLPPPVRAMHEFATGAARAQLGEEAFAAAQAEGHTMTPEQVLAIRPPRTR